MNVKRLPDGIEPQGADLIPIPPPKIDLRDAHAIRRELAAVYRDMRSGAIFAVGSAYDALLMVFDDADDRHHAFVSRVIRKRLEGCK